MNYDMGGGVRYDSEEYIKMVRGGLQRPLYDEYRIMKNRCENYTDDEYEFYGGRGIKICEEWSKPGVEGYEAFKKWALDNGYKPGMSLERIYTEKVYSPENCRWIRRPVINKTNNKDGMPTMEEKVEMVFNLLLDGKKRPFQQVCAETGISEDDFRMIAKRFKPQKAINEEDYHKLVILHDQWGYFAVIRNEL